MLEVVVVVVVGCDAGCCVVLDDGVDDVVVVFACGNKDANGLFMLVGNPNLNKSDRNQLINHHLNNEHTLCY